MTTTTHCASYQEFYEILLRIEDSKNMYNDSDEEEEKNVNQRKDDKGKGQSFQGPLKTQSFKRSEANSSSSSGGFSATGQRRGGRFAGGREGRQQAQGRVNNITLQDAQSYLDLIMGTLNILGHFARVLIGCGATNSGSSHTFAQVTQPHPMPPGFELEFAMPREEKCYVDYGYPGCPMLVEDVVMPSNLISLDIVDFEVILGTD